MFTHWHSGIYIYCMVFILYASQTFCYYHISPNKSTILYLFAYSVRNITGPREVLFFIMHAQFKQKYILLCTIEEASHKFDV